MKNKLHGLFDYQRFQRNKHLAAIISETEERYINKYSENILSYDDLEHINAAGDINAPSKKSFDKEDFDA